MGMELGRIELGRIEAMVVDVDGTLVDSAYKHTLAWAQAFEEVGVAASRWRIHRHVGMGGDHLVEAVAGGDVERRLGDHVRELERGRYQELIDEVQPFPAAKEPLATCRAAGLRVVLASSAKGEELERYLFGAGGRARRPGVLVGGHRHRDPRARRADDGAGERPVGDLPAEPGIPPSRATAQRDQRGGNPAGIAVRPDHDRAGAASGPAVGRSGSRRAIDPLPVVYVPVVAGILIAVFASTAAGMATLVPPVLLLTMAGLALMPALTAALRAVVGGPLVLGPLIAFAIALSDMSVMGLGPFFWSLVVGTLVSLLLEREGWRELAPE